MAETGEETIDLGLVLLILVAVGIGIYLLSKGIKGLGDGIAKTFGLQGASCVVSAITNPGQVTQAQADAIKACQEKTFPGICKKTVDANVDWAVNATNNQNANGPNAFQYAVNYWFGSSWGVPDATCKAPSPCTNAQSQQGCTAGVCSGCCGDGSLD